MRIFEFAKVADWESRLGMLAGLAEPERWTFLSVPSKSPLPILESYIKQTFIRVYDQQKIVEGDNLACFNTGLLTPGQEEIFGIFSLNDKYDRTLPLSHTNKKWWLQTWARSGDRLLTDFMELPCLAQYWNDPKDLIYDPTLRVQLNLDHIVNDNLSRFPEELGGKVDKNGVPTDLDEHAEEGDAESPVNQNQLQDVPLSTRNALEGGMKQSIRLAERNYRIAVPQFHFGKIQLLLPLYLRNPTKPDLALTLERFGGWYRAATVLYPDWAYRHARLLARPNSEWLGGFRTDVVQAVSQSSL